MWKKNAVPVRSVFVLLIVGCSQVDPKADFDSLVEDVWLDLNEPQQLDAIAYLEGGGRHYDVAFDGGATEVDRTILLPLLRRLKTEFEVEPIALVKPRQDFATAILVKLPADRATQRSIERAIQEADEEFTDEIWTEWGHRWLAIILMEPDVDETDE